MNISLAKDNYYAHSLSGADRALYDSCVKNLAKGIMRGEAVGSSRINSRAVIDAVLYGFPELFFVDNTVQIITCGNKVTLEFTCKYNDVEGKRKELYTEIDRIAAKLSVCGSTYDKLVKLSGILGDIVRGANNLEGRFGDAYGALVLKEARCEGYAKAAKLILDKLGVKSIIALGDAYRKGGKFPHAWNIVYCGDKPYGFDFTWNDGGDAGSAHGIGYLFLPDSDMRTEHSPQYSYPPCNDGSQTFWARNNGIIHAASDIRRVRVVRKDKQFIAAFRFDSESAAAALQKQAIEYVINTVNVITPCRSAAYNYNPALKVLSVCCTGNK